MTSHRPDSSPKPLPPAAALEPASHSVERIHHLFRRSLASGRIHPLYNAIMRLRGQTP